MRNFTPKDFDGCGQYLVKVKHPSEFLDASNLSTIMYKVGYCYGRGFNTPPNDHDNIIALIAMSDGWAQIGYYDDRLDPSRNDNPRRSQPDKWEWIQFNGKQVFCNYLNDPELCKNEFRFATQKEVIRVVTSQKNRWRG